MVSSDTTAMLEMLETSTDNLARSITDLADEQASGASSLPTWSRGHVLTHVARNADAMVNLLTWARTGTETPMYASRQARNDDIESGAGRTARELREDVLESQERFMKAAAALSAEQWRSPVRWGFEDRDASAELVPWLRLVEVEVHHVDLDLGYTAAHWPASFVQQQLLRTVEDRAPRPDTPAMTLRATDAKVTQVLGDGRGPVISGPQAALLAWLLGRSEGAGLVVDGEGTTAGSLPDLAPWR